MGLLDAILGRSKPVRPDLDQLFAVPSAALTLQAATGFTPTGRGSVCFAGVEGGGFARLQGDVRELLDADTERGGIPVEFSRDTYGYTWLLATHPAGDTAGLVNDLHAVNTMLQDGGFGPHLLCSLIGLPERGGPVAGAGLPLQARHVLPVRPAPRRRREAGQPAGTPGPGRPRRRPPGGEGPVPVVPGVGGAGVVISLLGSGADG